MSGAQWAMITQTAAGLVWLTVCLYFAPSLWRTLRRRGTAIDFIASIWCFIGEYLFEYVVRWWVFPGAMRAMSPTEISWWLSLHVRSALAGAALIAAVETFRRIGDRDQVRFHA